MVPADNVGHQRAWGGDMWLWDLEVLGYLMLDDTPLAKLPVLIAYVQQGIDIWGAYRNGGASWNRSSLRPCLTSRACWRISKPRI